MGALLRIAIGILLLIVIALYINRHTIKVGKRRITLEQNLVERLGELIASRKDSGTIRRLFTDRPNVFYDLRRESSSRSF
jgi:hypothetical protein